MTTDAVALVQLALERAAQIASDAAPGFCGGKGETVLYTVAASILALSASDIAAEARPVAQEAVEPTEEQVAAAAQIIADSPLIDTPKLPAQAWMGLARSILYAAPVAQSEDATNLRQAIAESIGGILSEHSAKLIIERADAIAARKAT